MLKYEGPCSPWNVQEVLSRTNWDRDDGVRETHTTSVYIKEEEENEYVGRARVKLLDDGRIWASALVNKPLPKDRGWYVSLVYAPTTQDWTPTHIFVSKDAHPECVPILDEADGSE